MSKRLLNHATLKDVASVAQVSVPIASRVLAGNPEVRVSTETRKRILKAADALAYRPNSVAKSLKLRRTYTLALLVPDMGNPVSPEIVRGVEEGARSARYSAFTCHLDEPAITQSLYIKWLQEGRFDGLILATAQVEDSVIEELVASGLPFVLVNRREVSTSRHVTVDDNTAARMAVHHLVGLGHRRIAHLAGLQMYDTALRRLKGYREELASNGIPYDPSLVEEHTWTTWEAGRTAMARLLQRNARFTAVFAGNLMGAAGALGALKEAGVRVPEDVSLIGLHDSPIAELLDPPLTVVKMPLREMGRAAALMLVGLLEGTPIIIPQVLPPEGLVIRRSTAHCAPDRITGSCFGPASQR